MGVIVVTGIPGVGKTTVMQRAAEGMDVKFVTFGTVMVDMAKETGLIKNRDDMRKMSLEQQKELQIKSAEKVASMGNVILDTHCTVKTPRGYMPGLPEWVIKRINPTAIVVTSPYSLNFFLSIFIPLCKVYITFCYINFTICKYKLTFLL